MACISRPEMYLQYVAAADCLQAEVVSTHDVITDQPGVQHVDFNFGRVHMSLALVHRSRCCLCVLYIKFGLWVC